MDNFPNNNFREVNSRCICHSYCSTFRISSAQILYISSFQIPYISKNVLPRCIQILRLSWYRIMKNSVLYLTHRQATFSDIRGDWGRIRFVWKWDALGKMAEAYPALLWLYGGSNTALLKAMPSKIQFSGQTELRCQKKKFGVRLSWQLGYCYVQYWLYKLAGRSGGLQERRNVGHFLPHYTISHPTRN